MSKRPLPFSDTSRTDALQVLVDASSILLSITEGRSAYSDIFRIANRIFSAEAYAVWRQVDTQGTWQAVATRGLSPGYRTRIHAAPGELPSIRAVEDALTEDWLTPFRSEYAAEGIRSLLVVRLALKSEFPATITFYWRTPRRFTQQDYNFASALANLASAAFNHEALHNASQREQQRLSFLAEASSILASSLDYETTLDKVAHLAVPHIADWCTVHILENGVPNRLVVAHADPAMLELAEAYSTRYPEVLDPARGLGKVLATGQSEAVFDLTDEMVAAAVRDPEQLALLRQIQITSSILVPLTTHGKILGAIRLLASGPARRHFTPEDVQLAEDLGRRAASAIENAQLHSAILQQGAQLRLVHSAARMGSWSWDLIRNEPVWSQEYRQLIGASPDEKAAPDAESNRIHPDDRERTYATINDALASDADQVALEYRLFRPDGRISWMQSRSSVQRDATGKPLSLTGITIDITESRLAEDALRRTEKLAAAGRLAATVAHEVNNPLEALTNLVYLAAHTDGLPDVARTYLLTAESELSRIAHIVRQTLGFYRDSSSPQPVDISSLAADIIELYCSRAESRNIRLTCHMDGNTFALANSGEIKQVVANLVSNALDATAPQGRVHAEVHQVDGTIRLTVADNGSGITEANLPHLFEPFFTTKAEVGTGLGLWVSKGIVDKHNGTVSVTSSTAPGSSGTTFTVDLPATERR